MNKYCIIFEDSTHREAFFECDCIEKAIKLTKDVFGDHIEIQRAVIDKGEAVIGFIESTSREAIISAETEDKAKQILINVFGEDSIVDSWIMKDKKNTIDGDKQILIEGK